MMLMSTRMILKDGKRLKSLFLVKSRGLETERFQHDLLTATRYGFLLNRL
jgi:hypothetical protein